MDKKLHCYSDTPLFLDNGTVIYPDPRCGDLNSNTSNISYICPKHTKNLNAIKNTINNPIKNNLVKKISNYYNCSSNVPDCTVARQSNKNAFVFINSHTAMIENDKKFNEKEFYLNQLRLDQDKKFKYAKNKKDFYKMCTTGLNNNDSSIYKYKTVCRAAKKRINNNKYYSSYSDLIEDEKDNL